MPVKIYHNPRCSKSRQTLQLLRSRGIEPEVVEYLKTPPTREELNDLLQMLDLRPRDLMRKREAPYADMNLADLGLDCQRLVEAMVSNPILIERPIVVSGEAARIGRPPERVLEII